MHDFSTGFDFRFMTGFRSVCRTVLLDYKCEVSPGFHLGSWRSRPSRPSTHDKRKDAQDAPQRDCQGLPYGRPLLPCVMPRSRSVIMAQITNLVRKTCWYGARTQQNREKLRKNKLGRLLTGVHTILNSVLSSADASIRVPGCTYNRPEYFDGFWKSHTYERTAAARGGGPRCHCCLPRRCWRRCTC